MLEHYRPHLELLNVYYRAKQLEYRETGFKTFPEISDLSEFLETLLSLAREPARAALPD